MVVVWFSETLWLKRKLSASLKHFSWKPDLNCHISALEICIKEFASNLIRRATKPQPILMNCDPRATWKTACMQTWGLLCQWSSVFSLKVFVSIWVFFLGLFVCISVSRMIKRIRTAAFVQHTQTHLFANAVKPHQRTSARPLETAITNNLSVVAALQTDLRRKEKKNLFFLYNGQSGTVYL